MQSRSAHPHWEDSSDEEEYLSASVSPTNAITSQNVVAEHLKYLKQRKQDIVSSGISIVLKVQLCNIRPYIWRRIRVPAMISLRDFQDKVLSPVIGWCRGYHGYYFRSRIT
jgi:hypothetical protein